MITVSPIEKTEIKPDLIMLYATPAQVNQLLLGLYKKSEKGMILEYITGEPISTCSYGIARAYNTKEPQLVLQEQATKGMASLKMMSWHSLSR